MTGFAVLPLSPPLAQAIDVLGFTQLTPVQEHALPPILAGKHVIAQARTGSGKTVAFGLGALSLIDLSVRRVQALVLCPTRELADQVSTELRRFARFLPNLKVVTLCGGVPVRTQTPSLAHPVHMVVGTPGRILDHLRRENLELGGLRVLVLDEADRMLDMGFAESILAVVAQTPRQRQTLLFSATYPDAIRTMSHSVQRAPVEITVDATHSAEEIEQIFFEVDPACKLDALTVLLAEHKPESALVFCHTRNDVRDVAARLAARGFSVLALHGELEQRERDEVLVRFSNRSAAVLVATDVAARGLDIKGLPAVIAWELPTDPDVHVHRIGRTGRAGQRGLALSLCAPGERKRAMAVLAQLGHQVRWGRLDLSAVAGLAKPSPAPMVTLMIEGGRQNKLRAGDLLGALTGDVGLAADDVGKIDIQPSRSYVAIRRQHAQRALRCLRDGKIKGKRFRAWALA